MRGAVEQAGHLLVADRVERRVDEVVAEVDGPAAPLRPDAAGAAPQRVAGGADAAPQGFARVAVADPVQKPGDVLPGMPRARRQDRADRRLVEAVEAAHD